MFLRDRSSGRLRKAVYAGGGQLDAGKLEEFDGSFLGGKVAGHPAGVRLNGAAGIPPGNSQLYVCWAKAMLTRRAVEIGARETDVPVQGDHLT